MSGHTESIQYIFQSIEKNGIIMSIDAKTQINRIILIVLSPSGIHAQFISTTNDNNRLEKQTKNQRRRQQQQQQQQQQHALQRLQKQQQQ
jgi:hypothetical protein